MPTFSRLDVFSALFWRSCVFFKSKNSSLLLLSWFLVWVLLPAPFFIAAWASVFVGNFYWPDPKLLLINMFWSALEFILCIIHQELSFLLILSSFFGELPLT